MSILTLLSQLIWAKSDLHWIVETADLRLVESKQIFSGWRLTRIEYSNKGYEFLKN